MSGFYQLKYKYNEYKQANLLLSVIIQWNFVRFTLTQSTYGSKSDGLPLLRDRGGRFAFGHISIIKSVIYFERRLLGSNGDAFIIERELLILRAR